ncbi:secondary thiamine-phosphate synthase enzyme [Caloramator fervidus]|uniref:Secondary thiamine-phosphate synthase enzyme n=1 Tax=Caloramator fervidus TaxID=29344 RepID=A0A1H5UUM2_9CLOT|nr:secondary thiamine-phosphate synthase enzyme YjbQ [Caloramator fervidus]SEF78670.1 secondary thiamine-phosphate synthase enzyme [Caloramator fervidus]
MEFTVKTSKREEFIDITYYVKEAVKSKNVKDGIAVVFVPHTTAAVTINENADPDVVYDMINTLDRLIPQRGNYMHIEGNSDAHLKASMFGSSVTVIIENGTLKLGTWQGIYFCEFDGPRSRKFYVKVIEG